MPYAIQCMEGRTPGEILPILGNAMIVGRSTGDILIEDAEVSARHCSLYMFSGELFVQDHGSRNGTLVNGQRVERIKLRPGDTIKVGPVEFRVVDWPQAVEFLDPLREAGRWVQSLGRGEQTAFAQDLADLIRREWDLCVKDIQLKMTIEARDGRLVNHVVPVGELVVGRSGTVPLLAEDEEASRKHARFFVEQDGKLRVEDLNSANGTFVNEERIVGIRELNPADLVRLGKTRMQVVLYLPEFSSPASSVKH